MIQQDPDGTAGLVAVVGMAGRFPGAPDVDSLWELMITRGDAIRPVPADRWDSSAPLDPEREVQSVGGFLDGVQNFDAGFFGISPREAADIDPQQRLMLEASWRALEDAGQRAEELVGSRTGVYVGASWHDYEILRTARGLRATQHSLVGSALDMIAARVSYALKLRGPSLTVETGCSSALVALHLATQALRTGEVDSAIVGGANLILQPDVSIGLTRFGGLSQDGRCAAFSASANGFVRGEGVAAVYLKTLERAVRDGDRIHGVIVRTVVNNDGGGDSLVTPNPAGQRDLLQLAYGDGVVPLESLAYIEAHGTGTGRGDPVEATAIGRTLGVHKTGGKLAIGSVKTNIGHLEAAAGMAGLFKVLLSLRHRTVPPSLHSAELNPDIAFGELNLEVVREPLTLPDSSVYLGVNSFGWGGTNAHAVVMNPPTGPDPRLPAAQRPAAWLRDGDGVRPTGLPEFLPLSAKHWAALAQRAGQLRTMLPDNADGLTALAGTLAHHLDHFAVRAAVSGTDPAALGAALDALHEHPEGEAELSGVIAGRAVPRGRTAFVFPGQGSQWSGMGRELYRQSPMFAAVVQRCAVALRPHVSWDLLDVFGSESDDEWMSRIDMLQPVLWAMSVGLAELWRASGIVPDVVLGHSQGEISAATFAGILSYEDAALIVARRSLIARRTSGRGLMLAVDLDRDSAEAALEGFETEVALAVHNGPSSCVLSGEREAVLMLQELLDAEGTYCRLVNVDYASHSPQMDELTDDLLSALVPLSPRSGAISLMSTARARIIDGTEMGTEYWVENLSRPVLFSDSLAAVLADGVTHVVEISPHPILAPAIEDNANARDTPIAVVTTLRRGYGCAADFTRALARGYVAGLSPFGGLPKGRRVPVPGYPLQQSSYWPDDAVRSSGAPRGFEVLVGPCPSEQDTWTGELEMSVADQPWLGDHRVFQAVVLPGTAMLALAINTARARTGALPHRIEQVEFSSGVTLGDGAERLTVQWRDDVSEGGSFRLLSLPAASTGWVRSAAARVLYGRPPTATSVFPEWFSTDQATGPDEFYLECAARGLEYGAAFQAVQCLQRRPDQQAVGRIELPRQLLRTNSFPILHPALWDGALQVALAVCGGDQAVVPTSIRDIRILRHPSAPVSTVWSHALRTEDGLVDVHVFDADRAPLLVMVGVELQPLQGAPDQELDDERLHILRWIEDNGPRPGPAAATGWVIHGDGDAADALTLAIRASGAAVSRADLDAAGPMAVPPSTGSGVLFVAPQAALGAAAQQLGLLRLTELVRACLAAPTPPNLTIVTVRATTGLAGAGGAAERAAVDTAAVDPGSALYSGYTRVLRREHPELEARLIDVDAAEPEWAIDCAAEVLSPDEEDQVALRRGRRWVGRLTRGRVPEDAGPMLPARRTGRQSFQVAVSRAGSLSDIEYVPLSRRPPGPGEVEVEITVGSINFIDVMKAVGTYPDPSGGAALLGGECAGRVVAVGADVTSPRIGDRVVACAFGSLASHVVVRADHAQLIPDQLTDTQAAAMPLVLVTAWYALAELGRLERGETVLIHSAAGGVGLAALQVAQHLGATVIATAGTAAKRAHLERLGVSAVYDSRDLSWADGVRARTAGRGVDVVLNSLTGAAIPLGLDVLAEDGRFIEIGKKDIYGGRAIGLGSFRKGISLSAVDLAGLISRRPARFARVFDTVWSLVAAGELTPLPVRTYRFAAVADALREFSRGDHIGKFVVVDPGTVELISPQPMPGGRFRPDGVYVITGGLGALGLSLAEFLAANGARRLALLGRSAPGAAAEERVATLREGGSQVEIVRCDVSDETALRQALDQVRDRLGVVRGVIHTAGVLDDATTPNITAQQLTNVLGPKVQGARHLDVATAGDPLDFFVLFSSAAALVGNVGQAAYAAANAYLDALAEGRRRRGLCALSVQWGPFLDIGLAARDAGRGARLDNRGMGGFPVAEAWPALLRMLDTDQPVIGYVPINLRQWFDAYPDTAALRSWALLYEAAQGGHSGLRSPSEFLAQLAQSSVEARVGLVETKVCELSGRVLRLDAGRIERETPFKEMGLDSLMSLELRNRLESAFGMKLSPTLLWTHGNAKALAAALVQKLPAPPSAAGIDPGTDRSAEHGTASAPTSRISSHA